jgi:Putative Flp pilus-assembly TadE/G-like
MTRRRSLSLHDQAGLIGKIAVFWLVVLVLVGLLVLDGISIVLATLRLSSTAQSAASTAATQYHNLHDAQKACTLASADLISDGVPVPENEKWCKVDTSTGEATIVLHSTASSLVLGRVSFTKDVTDVTVRESAEPAL